MKYRKAVFILAYRKEKNKIVYLVLKRKLHWKGWEFPKGGIEKGENIKEAVKRELLEETGKVARKIVRFNLKGKYKYDKAYPDRKGFKGQIWNLFAIEVLNKSIRLDSREHSSYKWLEFRKAEKILTWKNQKDCLKIVNQFLA